MKKHLYIYGILLLFALIGCSKDKEEIMPDLPPSEIPSGIPDDQFVVTFTTPSRGAITGQDSRIQSLLYIVYKTTGEYVKERIILTNSMTTPSWPLTAIKDTLPKGTYKAVFLANADTILFPYSIPGRLTNYSKILTNYQTTYANARLNLPNVEFKNNTEYYWANVPFSNSNATPGVLLQRILGKFNVHRNAIDTQKALDMLVNNIVTRMNYKNTITNTTKTILTDNVKNLLGPLGILLTPLGGLTAATDSIVGRLVPPVVNVLYAQLLQSLVHQLGTALAGNSDQATLLEKLGVLLNPWEFNEAHTAIVSLKNFPKSINFDLVVKEYYTGTQRFRFDFKNDATFKEKDLYIKGFSGLYNIQKINVIKEGLVSGLLVDQIIDGPLLLDGTFVDVTDSIRNNTATNIQYKSDYSLIDVGLKSYNPDAGAAPLTVSVQLKNVTNLSQFLTGLPGIGPILNIILNPLLDVTVTIPLNVPLLAISNLTISGKWSTPAPYQD